jgi:hypothetical protein
VSPKSSMFVRGSAGSIRASMEAALKRTNHGRYPKEHQCRGGGDGLFRCNGEGQVLASALSDLFDETILSTVGRTMAQTMAGLAIARRLKGDKK